jgi:hypothetical protein
MYAHLSLVIPCAAGIEAGFYGFYGGVFIGCEPLQYYVSALKEKKCGNGESAKEHPYFCGGFQVMVQFG